MIRAGREIKAHNGYGLVFSSAIVLITATDRMSGFVLVANIPKVKLAVSRKSEICVEVTTVTLIYTDFVSRQPVTRVTSGSTLSQKKIQMNGGARWKHSMFKFRNHYNQQIKFFTLQIDQVFLKSTAMPIAKAAIESMTLSALTEERQDLNPGARTQLWRLSNMFR